ncbi:YdeI/OmpD-associated family protein [Billgrantia lactosivorans]|uniref:YdeI/OmpD-associated family protein n=1 Tax=Billgrantia lactosivorans TaxID=2185141 RepID=UPI000DAC5C25|nr:YdeI/OmpD-associated family protein [Halomonas lactosivorans]
MKTTNPKVAALLNKAEWQEEKKKLRAMLLECGLGEDVKWGKLCYSLQGNNVAIIFAMKSYCAFGFFKGSLLKDPEGILVAPGEHSQAMRQVRFTQAQEIDALAATLKAYLHEAIAIEKAGLTVDFKEKHELEYPEEFQVALDGNAALKAAFEALTPGRQRGYILHFSGAKQSSTRASRIEKCVPTILAGKGLNDR